MLYAEYYKTLKIKAPNFQHRSGILISINP